MPIRNKANTNNELVGEDVVLMLKNYSNLRSQKDKNKLFPGEKVIIMNCTNNYLKEYSSSTIYDSFTYRAILSQPNNQCQNIWLLSFTHIF